MSTDASGGYEPGTVAVATVRGVPNVRIFRSVGPLSSCVWSVAAGIPHTRLEECDVTDIRPLVVLDIAALRGQMVAAPTAEEVPSWLRNLADSNTHGSHVLGSQAARLIADQIEAQTKPPRIPEPGLWGVVEAGVKQHDQRLQWVRLGDNYRPNAGDEYDRLWSDLIDPVVIRPGIEDPS